MGSIMRLRDLNPLRLLNTTFVYERLPSSATNTSSPWQRATNSRPATSSVGDRFRCGGRLTPTRLIWSCILGFVTLALLVGGGYRRAHSGTDLDEVKTHEEELPFFWQHYWKLNDYYNGIRTLVVPSEHTPGNRYNASMPPGPWSEEELAQLPREPSIDPLPYDPYPAYDSKEYQSKYGRMEKCYIDEHDTVAPPDVYAYHGLPQNMEDNFYGSYKLLGIPDDKCWERFGRLGPYGYGYNESQSGLHVGNVTENAGADKIWRQHKKIDYTKVDWGSAQKRCFEKNKARFNLDPATGERKVKRHAYVLRVWTNYKWADPQILSLRAMINELNLRSGGEYDVHFLLHIKNNSLPIWADKDVYNQAVRDNMPKEFWNMTTLWSEKQMEMYYPSPFPGNFANMVTTTVHGVYRSAHFALQWFSQQHPEYDFFWNWEMDLRFSGHYYEFNTKIGEWARNQPRKGLWERSAKFYIPEYHGSWHNFTKTVELETEGRRSAAGSYPASGPIPIWGPITDFPNTGAFAPLNETIPPTSYEEDNYQWGVGEDADIMTFNPLFDPSITNWVFRNDITGYDLTQDEPPRRAAIITVARLSKRLLDIMHRETWQSRHTMFPEMWPPTACLHHGLKGVYIPHPVYFDRDWSLSTMDQVFNFPKEIWETPFGWGEHNMLGGSFYYNAGFSSALWRRWLGLSEQGEGGKAWEEANTGRMCMKATLHHPIKHESGPAE
ncbi:hypothetical protein K431DRAFT_282963 [Polychaeton citri CBS 116435]|uniref:Major facilitator superfamily transporter n=1 Tax=Polychaeton citri CBS 116435 TaxID=1314669 RepID=A0A9P4QD66_9PEZI|nr:hypothetical protein K431DRAFT_282963 [Polychaeton citri CBS 116435]